MAEKLLIRRKTVIIHSINIESQQARRVLCVTTRLRSDMEVSGWSQDRNRKGWGL